MGWLAKLFRMAGSEQPGRGRNGSGPIGEFRRLLNKHIGIQMEKAAKHVDLVPPDCVRRSREAFENHLDDIARATHDAGLRATQENHAYQDVGTRVYLVVSVFPWTTEETIEKLRQASTEPPFGYVSMMTKMFINGWPSADLTHFLHVLVCLGEGTFHMHTALGDYGGFPGAPRDFTVFPVDLLNEDERRMIGS
ncbi:MAG: hypothetical protein R3F30_00680 [Planctomycetota bacterium]